MGFSLFTCVPIFRGDEWSLRAFASTRALQLASSEHFLYRNKILVSELWWPTTVTAKPKTSWQKQKHHGETKNLTAKTKYVTAKPKTSRQNQILHSKNKIALVLPWVFAFAVRYLVFAVKYLVLPWGLWFCREGFGFVVRYFIFAVRFLVLPWGFRFCREVFCFCHEVFGFAVTVVGHRTRTASSGRILKLPNSFYRKHGLIKAQWVER